MITSSFICIDCGEVFDEPLILLEGYEFNDGLFDGIPVCPHCGGGFTAAHYCDECGEPITDTYVRLSSGKEICDNCFLLYEFGED